MKVSAARVLAVAEKVKTPLSLSGVVVAVLYLIIRQILSLDLFSRIDSPSTFTLLQNLVDKLFWLAALALVLGVSSYILSTILARRVRQRESRVSLVDSRLDKRIGEYEETVNGTRRVIRPKKQTNRRAD